MIRKLFILLSAIYLSVFGVFQLMRFWPRYDFVMNGARGVHQAFLAVNLVVFTLFGLLSIIMGMGLLNRKNWARELLVVISGFALFFGISLIICSVFLYYMLPYGSLVISHIYNLYYWAYEILCLVAMPLFFIIFFTRKSVISLFPPKK